MPPRSVPADRAAGRGPMSVVPLMSAACLGTLLCILASTIVLALIPVYLATKSLNNLPTTGNQFAVLSPSPSPSTTGTVSTADCNNIGSAMSTAAGFASGAATPSSCTFASTSARRRRRASFLSRTRRLGAINLFMPMLLDFAISPKLRSAGHRKKAIGKKFTVTITFLGVPTTITFTVIGFTSTPFGTLFTQPTTVAITTTTTVATGAASG